MTLIITLTDFDGRVQISDKRNSKILNIAINNAQEIYLKPILGKDLFDEMIADFGSYTPTQQALYDALVPYLVYQSAINYFSTNGATDTQSGLRIHTDEFSTVIDPAQYRALLENIRSMVQQSEVDLLSFLETNKVDYPSWQGNCKYQNSSSYPFSVVGGSRKQKNKYRGNNDWLGKE